jgi:hypothetical protein
MVSFFEITKGVLEKLIILDQGFFGKTIVKRRNTGT